MGGGGQARQDAIAGRAALPAADEMLPFLDEPLLR